MANSKQILVTSALPYANGALHLGHILEFIQTDIWVRFNKLQGHKCIYLGADDAHGTAIMLKAADMGISAEELIDKVNQEHQRDLQGFLVDFDYYGSTHSESNRQLSYKVFNKLKEKGYITTRNVTQLFDDDKGIFLSDRFVKGQCPKCGASDQYGDNCEVCGATYNAMELKQPYSTLSNTVPVKKDSEHYFLELGKFKELLESWLQSNSLQPEVVNKLSEWLDAGLKDWDISRDAPYFGFTIPGEAAKYFYVWLDAPVGYMSAFLEYAKDKDIDFSEYWGKDSISELHHFIGKDILYFHGLFWPAMLYGSEHRLPTAIYAHGFVTIEGKKMSKSRGTFINARDYLEHCEPEYLRYYFASKLTKNIQDIDINAVGFVNKINADLIGKVVNIASRSSKFINKYFDSYLACELDADLLSPIAAAGTQIAACYQDREYSKAMRSIVELAEVVNQYLEQHKPWLLIKDTNNHDLVQKVCSSALNAFRSIVIYLQPVLPQLAQKAELLFNDRLDSWNLSGKFITNHKISQFKPLMCRLDTAQVSSIFTATA